MTCRQHAISILGNSGEEWIRAGTCLLAALVVGPNNKRIHAHTGVPMGDVNVFGFRLRKAGVWKAPRTMHYPWIDAAEEGDERLATAQFITQVAIAVGTVVPTGDGLFRAAKITEGNGVPELPDGVWEEAPMRHTFIRERFTTKNDKRRKVLV